MPEDLRFARTSGPQVEAAAPGMDAWLQWVFAVLGGQMTAVGILLIAFSWRVWRGAAPTRTDAAAYAGAGAFTVLLMSGVNFAIGSDFRWVLVLPVILWLVAVGLVTRLARSN